ncbi:MAG: pentapeptide repeat-containing protein, partial [Cyanobacteria bacterium P01_F01_bin.3]
MTAIDFSALIEEGADAWNQWRTDHPTVQPDLSRAYLYGYDLSGFDLSNANLERACLIGANLQDANLSGACLQSAYASDSILSEATLTGAILTQGNFRGADFSGADLSAASVEGTEFGGANLTGSCLAALRANHATSFSEAQGEYVYLNLPPAERYPLVGACQPGELAQFLQQRFSGGIEKVVSSKPVPRRYRWRQLRIATMQLWALSKIQWRKLRKQLGPIAQQAYQYLQTDILPACNLLNANSLSRRML